MEDNTQGFSPEDFGLDSKAVAETSTPDQSAIPKFHDDSPMSKIDLSRMKMVLDVPLKVTVELGRTKLLVNDLLQLGQGSVIELDKMAGEPMEIYINDKLVAMGEVVVVNEKFGVRLTDVMSGLGIEDVPPPDAV
ncbi:flagellar motor switch protein FliN [bacterium]|nr:flagellar motor switch protein FliN [bacterium]